MSEHKPIMNKTSFMPLILGILFFGGITISDAYAYIDPGSGSIVIQAIIGALVGVGITLKVYWTKIRMAIETKFSKS